jgi:hypothetical protein
MGKRKLKECSTTTSGSIATVVGGVNSNYYKPPPKPVVKDHKTVMNDLIKRLATESTIPLEEKRQMLESWLRSGGEIVHSCKLPARMRYEQSLESQLNTIFENITITRK